MDFQKYDELSYANIGEEKVTLSMKILQIIVEEIDEWFRFIFIDNVPGRIGIFLRRIYWAGRFFQSGSFRIERGCLIKSPGNMSIGDGVIIKHNCCLYANNSGRIKIGERAGINSGAILGASDHGEIFIGNNVLIGPNVVFRASNHRFVQKDIPVKEQGHTKGRIIVEDDVWIGANAVILAGVTIGKGAVIGAGAVVTRDMPSYSLACGVPARVIKENNRA